MPGENSRQVLLDEAREKHLESRPFPRGASHRDRAFMLLDDAVHHPKAQTGPFGTLFCREERVEYPLHGLRVHTRPRVADTQPEIGSPRHAEGRSAPGSRGEVGQLYSQRAPFLPHRIGRVGGKVYDDLLCLSGIGKDERRFGREAFPYLYGRAQ